MIAPAETALRLEIERDEVDPNRRVWAIYQDFGDKAVLLKRSDATYPNADAAKRVGVKVRLGMLSAAPASEEDLA